MSGFTETSCQLPVLKQSNDMLRHTTIVIWCHHVPRYARADHVAASIDVCRDNGLPKHQRFEKSIGHPLET